MARNSSQRGFQVAAVQLCSTDDVARNLTNATRLIRRAAAAGAELIALPENFAYLRSENAAVHFRTTLDDEPVRAFRELARELGCHILLGSIQERIPRSRKIHNTSVLIDDRGRIGAVYRKLHLFDLRMGGANELVESRNVTPGERPVLARTRLGRMGLSICYDLRFPELYRRLALDGAEVLFIPAAFTAFTGPHHWLPLLRARAIENQCWVVAPAQVGRHSPTRESHGETAIIDPWGRVVRRLPRRVGFVTARIDLDEVERIRRGLPCLKHVRRELLGRF